MADSATRAPRRLYRSTSDRKIAGVCGGLGDYFGIDPVLFRLGFVLLLVFGGAGLLAYVIAWLVLPEGPGDRRPAPAREDRQGGWTGPAIVGGILVVVGIVTLLDSSRWFGFGFDGPELLWPLLLIGGGAYLLLRERGDRSGEDAAGSSPPDEHPATTGTDVELHEWDAEGGGGGFGSDTAELTAEEPMPAPPARRGPSVTRLTLGVLLLYFGVVALGGLLDWWEVDAAAVLAIALVVTGIGLVVSAFLGQGWPLLFVGIAIAFVLVPVSVIDVPVSAGVGERTYEPQTIAEVRDEYELGIGQLVVDLRDLEDELVPGEVVDIDARLGIGELRVIVPDDVRLDLELDAGIGQSTLELVDQRRYDDQDGFGADLDLVVEEGTEAARATVRIDARVGLGQVVVADRG